MLPGNFVEQGGIPIHGITQLGLRSHPTGSSTLEAPTTTFSCSRSDKPVLSTAVQTPQSLLPYSGIGRTCECHLSFLTSGIPIGLPGGVHHFHRRLDPGLGRPLGGFPDCRCMDPCRTWAPNQCSGAQGSNYCPPSLGCNITGPSCVECYRQYHCGGVHQQTRWEPFPPPAESGNGPVFVATDSGHNSESQTYSGLPKCDSRPPVSAEPAHHDRVEAPPQSRESDIQTVGNFNSGHVCHSPQHSSSLVHVSSSRASSTGNRCLVTGLAGEVDVHFHHFPC